MQRYGCLLRQSALSIHLTRENAWMIDRVRENTNVGHQRQPENFPQAGLDSLAVPRGGSEGAVWETGCGATLMSCTSLSHTFRLAQDGPAGLGNLTLAAATVYAVLCSPVSG